MNIDRKLSPIEIHKAIYDHVTTLGLKHRFKMAHEFEDKWYRDANEGPFVLFPHPSVDDPEKAMNTSPYPNVWIRHDPATGELEYGIAFWSPASIDQRFVNFSHHRSEAQRTRVLSILKGLPESWHFRVYQKKRRGKGEIVYESICNKMSQEEIAKVASDVPAWRAQWKKETTERGDSTTPAIHLMQGASIPEESDERIVELFNAFDQLVEMTPTKMIQEDLKKSKKELQAKIDNLARNLDISNYKKEIESRLKGLRQEMEQLG